MRKTTEEKTLDHAESVLNEIKELYSNDSISFVEYATLAKYYKKLYTKLNSIIRINDCFEKDTTNRNELLEKSLESTINRNELLEKSLEYTIETARRNLRYNVIEHKKTKQTLAASDVTTRKNVVILENKLKNSYAQIDQLKVDLEYSQKTNTTDNPALKSTPTLEINLTKFKNYSYKILLDVELKKAQRNNSKLVIAKLTVDNLNELKESLANSAQIGIFLRAFTRYLDDSFKKEYIIYYLKENIYYLILQNLTLAQAEAKIYAANIKMTIKKINMKISIGATITSLKDDSFLKINERCDLANNRATLSNNSNFRINCIKPTSI